MLSTDHGISKKTEPIAFHILKTIYADNKSLHVDFQYFFVKVVR